MMNPRLKLRRGGTNYTNTGTYNINIELIGNHGFINHTSYSYTKNYEESLFSDLRLLLRVFKLEKYEISYVRHLFECCENDIQVDRLCDMLCIMMPTNRIGSRLHHMYIDHQDRKDGPTESVTVITYNDSYVQEHTSFNYTNLPYRFDK